MTEQTTPQESHPSPERFSTHNEMVALHTRMILDGEALNPEKRDIPAIKEEQLTLERFNQTVKIAAKGSVVDRLLWWEKEWQEQVVKDSSLAQLSEEKKAAKQYQIWKEKMIASFSNEKNKDRLNKLAQRKIGGIDFSGFNQQTCDQIYQRYFANQQQEESVEVVVLKENGQEKYYLPSGLSQFIDDVIAAYNGNYDEIVADLPALKWYAGIFGSARKEEIEGKQPKGVHTDDILKELIHARIKLENEPKKQELATQANESKTINGQETTRQNFFNPKEQQHLQWLWEARQLEMKVIKKKALSSQPSTEPNPSRSPSESQDWQNLRDRCLRRYLYYGEIQEVTDYAHQEWEKINQIREIFRNSEVAKKGLPVYYPGARGDIIIPLALTNADNFVFVDFDYVDKNGNLNNDALPDRFIEEIGGKIISITTEGEFGKGGKRVIKFDWGGRTRTITCYAEDATKFTPKELEGGASFILLIAPHGEPDPDSSLISPDNLAKFYPITASGGFINWKPTRVLELSVAGFKQLVERKGGKDVFGLFQKEKALPNLNQVLSFDLDFWQCLSIPNGLYIGTIDENTLNIFRNELQKIKNIYPTLPPDVQANVLTLLRDYYDLEKMSDEEKTRYSKLGKSQNLDNPEKLKEYLEKVKRIINEVFPEVRIERSLSYLKALSDILQAIKEKTEAGEPCQMEFDQEGLKMILENLVPSLEFKKGLITLKPSLTQPPEVSISQKQGRIKLPLKINAGILGKPQVTLSLTLDEQLNYVSVSSQPEKIFGQNLSQIIHETPLLSYLKDLLQKQLDQQRAGIDIGNLSWQFTDDNKLSITIQGKRAN